jgi:hypothetical protein
MPLSIPEFLRSLPPGWRFVSASANIDHLVDDEPPFGVSSEDLLEDFIILHSDSLQIALEMDWFPERSLSGQFTLNAIDFSDPERLTDSYAKPIRTFTTRSLRGALEEMFRWMVEFNANKKTGS